jgi:hypothetical protein
VATNPFASDAASPDKVRSYAARLPALVLGSSPMSVSALWPEPSAIPRI